MSDSAQCVLMPVQDRMQLSVYSQGGATSEDGNDGTIKDEVVPSDDDRPAYHKEDRVHEWLQENTYNDQ